MPLRSDHRLGDGRNLLAAPVAIAMLDTAGINIDRRHQLALTHVEVQLLDPADETAGLDGSDRLQVEALSARMVRAGKQGPFVATAEVLATTAPGARACRTTMTDEGAGGRVVALAYQRFRLLPQVVPSSG